MAAVTVNVPKFRGHDYEDVDVFIANYLSHLNALGINPIDHAGGPPSGSERAIGILRSCLEDEASRWFELELAGKNWELSNIVIRGAANLDRFRQLTVAVTGVNGGGVLAGTYVPGSSAYTYATDPANAAVVVGVAFLPNPATVRVRGMNIDIELKRAGGRPTDRPANIRGANSIGGVLAAAAGEIGNTMVLPGIKPEQALFWLRDQFPTILEEKRQLIFSDLYQEIGEPIRSFYLKVRRAGKILGYEDKTINSQFFRGMLSENAFEADRAGDISTDKLIETLSKLERRRGDLRSGMVRREFREKYDTGSLGQGSILKKESSSLVKQSGSQGISQDQLDQLLKKQADMFQAQIQQLQKSIQERPIQKPPVMPARPQPKPQPRPQREPDYHDDDPNAMYDDPDSSWRNHEADLRIIMGEDARIARKIAKKLRDAKDRREDRELTQAMRNLTLEGDEMDVDTARFEDLRLFPNDDGSFSILPTRMSKKK